MLLNLVLFLSIPLKHNLAILHAYSEETSAELFQNLHDESPLRRRRKVGMPREQRGSAQLSKLARN